MNVFIDFIPVFLFFLAFKLYGIYTATLVGIAATALQVLFNFLAKRKLDKQQLITLIIFVLFGGMTLYFHNPIFVKWKPSIVFWVLSAVLMLSHFIAKKPLIQTMITGALEKDAPMLTQKQWSWLNIFWAFFLSMLGVINIVIAYHFSTEFWVNFKVFGILGCILFASIFQSLFLMRYGYKKQ